jgi:hypothetical protein
VRITDAREGVHFRGGKARYSTGETTPSAPDFSKYSVTITTSPGLSSRVSSESATLSPPNAGA